ncbi:MAG: hypothetical protein GXP47_14675 [Acidobacteria bacterium]|nr:hypothetical protein [Acidobacteriota bacterium]
MPFQRGNDTASRGRPKEDPIATSLSRSEGFLGARNLKFQRDDARSSILVPFGFAEAGFDRVVLVVRLQEDGELFEIIVPNLFTYPDGPNKLPLMQTLLHISWETKMLQWEYDPSDGEIRATIELPLEDAVMTSRQLFRAFDAMLQLVQVHSPRIRAVTGTGADPGRRSGDTAPDELARPFLDVLHGGGGDTGGSGPGSGGDEPPDAL